MDTDAPVTSHWILPPSDFLTDLKIMYPNQLKSQFVGTIMAKQVFYDLFSNFMVKCWQSKMNSCQL